MEKAGLCLSEWPLSVVRRPSAKDHGAPGFKCHSVSIFCQISQIKAWTNEFILPTSVWLPGFFNPQSFLTAIMQSTARKQELPLDKMCLITDVTNITCRDALANPPKEGVYVHGLYMEVIESWKS